MNRFFILLIAAVVLTACDISKSDSQKHGEAAQKEAGHVEDKGEAEKGPQGGRLLEDGNLAVEVTIFERGVPPEFRVFVYRDGKPLPPAEAKVAIELTRLGGRVDRFAFTPQEGFLRGNAEVVEPHSFDVNVMASVDGKPHAWNYESYEGRAQIAADMAKQSGIQTAVAGPATLRERIALYGVIEANAERVRQVSARYPGIIRSVKRQIGDRVGAGDVLATIESNESLQTYALTAPIAGVVTERMANVGENTGDAALFVITDLRSVWAELSVFPRDRGRLAVGQAVQVKAADSELSAAGKVTYVSPVGGTGQPLVARVVLDNGKGLWTPGMFVNGEVTVGQRKVPLAVPLTAVQSLRDWKVVFANVGDTYEARPLELGRDDGEWVEVMGGHLAAGDTYVAANSFLVKADIEKSGASHDH